MLTGTCTSQWRAFYYIDGVAIVVSSWTAEVNGLHPSHRWYHPNTTRHQAEAELQLAEEGVYLLRPRFDKHNGDVVGYSVDIRFVHVKAIKIVQRCSVYFINKTDWRKRKKSTDFRKKKKAIQRGNAASVLGTLGGYAVPNLFTWIHYFCISCFVFSTSGHVFLLLGLFCCGFGHCLLLSCRSSFIFTFS